MVELSPAAILNSKFLIVNRQAENSKFNTQKSKFNNYETEFKFTNRTE